ncbi:MAG: M48 family metallopeptidase [Sphingorhabdus sp.]
MTRKLLLALAAASFATGPVAALAADQEVIAAKERMKASAFDYTPQDDDERGLWLEMDEQEREIKNSKFLIRDQALNDYIRSVLCKAVGKDRCGATRIYVVRTPYFNASMAPNGMMVVWTGLLLRARNEAELATVLAHEFGHFENLHSLQSFRDIRAKTDAMAWLSFLPYGIGLIGQVGLIGSVFSFNRDMERQADMVAVDYMAAHGYDPRAAADIWEHFRAEMDATAAERNVKSRKDKNSGFFATHPNSGERMEYLRAAAAKKGADGFSNGSLEYRAAMADWWPKLIDDQIKLNDFGATEFLLGQLAASGWTPELLYARGELYRARGKEGDFQKAVDFYRQSIGIGSSIAENWRGLGISLMRSGEKEDGQKALREYLAKRPDAADKAMISMMAGVV